MMKTKIFQIFNRCMLIIYHLFTYTPRPRIKKLNEVLIVGLAGLGDVTLSFDLVRAYRDIFEGKKLVFITRQIHCEYVESTKFYDEVICMPNDLLKNNFRDNAAFFSKLRKRRFYAAVKSTVNKNIFIDLYVKSLNAAKKITINSCASVGSHVLLKKIIDKITNRWYDEVICTNDHNDMILIRQAKFARALGAYNFKADLPCIPVLGAGIQIDVAEYAVVFPGASQAYKKWELEKFAKVIRHLYKKYGLQCVLLGTSAEKNIAEKIKAAVKGIQVFDFVGKTTGIELAETIRNAKIYIGNDTGPTHIAVAVGTKTICIMSEYQTGVFFPYTIESESGTEKNYPVVVCHKMDCGQSCWINNKKKYHRCRRRNKVLPCVSAVTVESVCESVDKILNELEG